MFEINKWLRDNVMRMKPYSCARNEFSGEASVYVDANENPFNTGLNRYPDPLQWELKRRISQIKGVDIHNIMLGNGSDEPIDLLIRMSCDPGVHNIVAMAPSYGMYEVSAATNNVQYRQIPLREDYSLDGDAILAAVDEMTRLVFLCSPNNPSGNLLAVEEIEKVVKGVDCVVVVDEAYIDFAGSVSYLDKLSMFPNLVVLQTLSKAWGMAGLRLGMAFASKELIASFNKIKYPYNINSLTQTKALEVLQDEETFRRNLATILSERDRLGSLLASLPLIRKVYPTDANFYLVRVDDANAVYDYLLEKGIIVRNRNNVLMCGGCLRITVGIPEENAQLIEALESYPNK